MLYTRYVFAGIPLHQAIKINIIAQTNKSKTKEDQHIIAVCTWSENKVLVEMELKVK